MSQLCQHLYNSRSLNISFISLLLINGVLAVEEKQNQKKGKKEEEEKGKKRKRKSESREIHLWLYFTDRNTSTHMAESASSLTPAEKNSCSRNTGPMSSTL
ncbi:hypothetical protein NECID01_0984 [Nematocida sp. AWRm77]|nr:hypothetical protein NECID01_0984 [Nematocida sp. AWRm77]